MFVFARISLFWEKRSGFLPLDDLPAGKNRVYSEQAASLFIVANSGAKFDGQESPKIAHKIETSVVANFCRNALS